MEAQVDGRRSGSVRCEDGVGKLEEGVAPSVEAFVERAAEGAKSIGRRFHSVPIMHPPRAFCILSASAVKTQAKVTAQAN